MRIHDYRRGNMPVPELNQPLPASRRLLRDDVYDRILSAILEGTLKPGERLHDEELQQWLGVSRTPIRQALERIVEIGLIEMSPNRYTRVSLPDLNKLIGILEINVALWNLALEKTVTKLTDGQIYELNSYSKQIAEICEKTNSAEISDSAHKLTKLILKYTNFFIDVANNEVLDTTIKDMQPQLTYMLRATISILDPEVIKECFTSLNRDNQKRDANKSKEHLEKLYQVIKFELENSTAFH